MQKLIVTLFIWAFLILTLTEATEEIRQPHLRAKRYVYGTYNGGLYNPPVMRSVSNGIDSLFGWNNNNPIRTGLHGAWHYGVGMVNGNQREIWRAQQQWRNGGWIPGR